MGIYAEPVQRAIRAKNLPIAVRRGAQARAFLLDVRAEILLDGNHASQVRDYAAKPAEKEPLSSSEAVEQARKRAWRR